MRGRFTGTASPEFHIFRLLSNAEANGIAGGTVLAQLFKEHEGRLGKVSHQGRKAFWAAGQSTEFTSFIAAFVSA